MLALRQLANAAVIASRGRRLGWPGAVARAAAGLRTSAAHARWEEIDLGDVAPVIERTKGLIGAHLT
jgi:hypothetical protein